MPTGRAIRTRRIDELRGQNMGPLGVPEMIVIGIVALLLFGKRLPEVARSLGKGVVEFKKGLRGIDDEPTSN